MTQQGKNAIDLVLAESLIELSAKKPIDKITIKEITDTKRSALLVVKIEYCYAFNITHSINQCFVCL